MGLKNRILRRDPDPAIPIAADDTAQGAVPAPAEPTAQGDPVTGAPEVLVEPEQPEVADAEHAAQGDTMVFAAAGGPVAAPEPDPGAQLQTAPPAPRRPGFRERGQLRRRLRFLREARELGFRDLGGLVFDQHRFQRPNEALVQGKVSAIDAADRELRLIEDVLGVRRPYEELFVAGVSACQRCGALHGSDARFCPHCGLAFGGPRAVAGMWTDDAGVQAGTSAPPGQSALFDPQAPRSEAPAPPA